MGKKRKQDLRDNPRPTNTALHAASQGNAGKIYPLTSGTASPKPVGDLRQSLTQEAAEDPDPGEAAPGEAAPGVSQALSPSAPGWGADDPALRKLETSNPQLKGSLELALQDTDAHPPDAINPTLSPDLGSSQAATIWSGETPPPLIFSDTDNPAKFDVRAELLIHTVWQLFLRGYSPDSIGRKVGISFNKTRRLISQIKQKTAQYMVENPQVFGAPLETLYLQTLRRRERQSALWEELTTATAESVRPQYYRLIAEEDKAIENLLGMSKETLAIVLGSPAQHASADLLKQAGPEGLKDILVTIRDICLASTGQPPTLESTQTIEGSVRELKQAPTTLTSSAISEGNPGTKIDLVHKVGVGIHQDSR